jgi:hypothetical protein
MTVAMWLTSQVVETRSLLLVWPGHCTVVEERNPGRLA